jgi:hypothetical protein
MGFSFRRLTSNALLPISNVTITNQKDVADVPATTQGHTSVDASQPDHKLGNPKIEYSISDDSDSEINKVDTTAESGVQAIQAATHVWTKRDLILAYIL